MAMDIKAVIALVEQLARCTTPEEEFEERKAGGVVHVDGSDEIYADAGEMEADFSDDRLMDDRAAFMDFVRRAKELMK